MAEVLLHPDAHAWLQDQQPDLRNRIENKLEAAGEDPDHYLTPLSGRDTYKLRIGSYRGEIEWDKDAAELRVIELGHRDGFYD